MADSLEELPEGNAMPTPQEEEIMKHMFGPDGSGAPPPPPQQPSVEKNENPQQKAEPKKKGWFGSGGSSSSGGGGNKLKIILISTALFFVLSVPFIDSMVGAIPYANMAPTWILKTLLFAIIMAITVWLLC